MTQIRKSNYKRARATRHDTVIYVAAVAFLIGYLFGTGIFRFSFG